MRVRHPSKEFRKYSFYSTLSFLGLVGAMIWRDHQYLCLVAGFPMFITHKLCMTIVEMMSCRHCGHSIKKSMNIVGRLSEHCAVCGGVLEDDGYQE
jgi:hypothetical protein